MTSGPIFLTLDEVLEAHADMLELFGGAAGVRDIGLLESAIAQPQATFGAEFLLPDIFAMAAAYLFGIAKNHPFIDGNKRTAAATAIIFLETNGIDLEIQQDEELAEITEQIATGVTTKEQLVAFFKARAIEG